MKRLSKPIEYGVAFSVAVTMLVLPSSGKESLENKSCPRVKSATYIVLGYGEVNSFPAARLLKERWQADGSIDGERINRDGDTMLESKYVGHWEQLPSCDVIVHRLNGKRVSKTRDFINADGYASRAISITPGTALKKEYWLAPLSTCSESNLEGRWLGEFSGKFLKNGQWLPYEGIARLSIIGSRIEGLLLSSRGGALDSRTMQGQASLEKDCFGTLQWQDQDGKLHTDRTLLSGDGARAILLNTNPGLFSVGVIKKEKQDRRAGGSRQSPR